MQRAKGDLLVSLRLASVCQACAHLMISVTQAAFIGGPNTKCDGHNDVSVTLITFANEVAEVM